MTGCKTDALAKILDEQIRQMDAWRQDDGLEIGERLKVIREQRATIAEKRKHGGAGDDDGNADAAIDLFDPAQRRKLLREALNDKPG